MESNNNNNNNIGDEEMKMAVVVENEINNTNFIELYGKFVLDMLCKSLSMGWTTDIRFD